MRVGVYNVLIQAEYNLTVNWMKGNYCIPRWSKHFWHKIYRIASNMSWECKYIYKEANYISKQAIIMESNGEANLYFGLFKGILHMDKEGVSSIKTGRQHTYIFINVFV